MKWREVSEGRYEDMLGAVPPIAGGWFGGFLVGEAMDHGGPKGEPRYSAFRRIGHDFKPPQYFEAVEPMTVKEFDAIRSYKDVLENLV